MTKLEEEYNTRISELEKEVRNIYEKSFDREDGWNWYCNHPKLKQLEELKREYRLILKDYELTDIRENFGSFMTLEEFIDGCKVGPMFTDYDGFGNYATKDKVSNIIIYPSDITSGKYRKDFTHIMWYNK
jgi:hypothetical protein